MWPGSFEETSYTGKSAWDANVAVVVLSSWSA